MKRVMVLGVSSGVGKSTFARRLGEILKIPVYHLDALYWRSGWVEAPPAEFAASQAEIAARGTWIIEGNYTHTFEIRAERADTIIYLELPFATCLYRVFRRWLTNIGRTRIDMAPGCKEKLDFEFIRFICTTYHRRKANMETRLRYLNTIGEEKAVIRLKGKRAIRAYLEQLGNATSI